MSDNEEAYSSGGEGWEEEPSKVKCVHTMIELEGEINDTIIESCKVDACLDCFLDRLIKSKEGYTPRRWSNYPDLKSFEEIRVKELAAELRDNVERLIPGYLARHSSASSVLENTAIQMKLQKRWPIFLASRNSPGQNRVPKALLDVLMEKQLQRRSGGLTQDPLLGTSSETEPAFIETCRQLRALIDGEQTTSSFACGGAIPITSTDATPVEGNAVSYPVNIFWSSGVSVTASRLVLPLNDTATGEATSPETLQHLVASCDPASFGRGQEDVLDLSYRRAGKIDPEQFATSFHPADFSIIETIERVLLPSISSAEENELQFRKIRAELYKINVYSGPSGLFRSHVDTPQSTSQVGSLVVCLPAPFQGGNLAVRHQGKEVNFDWAPMSACAIQWAAFYSNCEHEIQTITQGDRITLTYNLYVTDPEPRVMPSIVDPTTLPLYDWMKGHLLKPGFMDEGGVLGIFCSHAYAHTSGLAQTRLPRTLKGADLVLYSIFKSLGLDVEILPVLESGKRYADANPALGLTGVVGGKHIWEDGDYEFYMLQRYLEKDEQIDLSYNEILPPVQSSDDYGDIDRRWKLLMLTRRVKGMKQAAEFAKKNDVPMRPGRSFYEAEGARIGACLEPYKTTDWCTDYGEAVDDALRHLWPAYYLPGITWITEPKHAEMAFSHLAHGNEASLSTQYSCAAILAVIPPVSQRDALD
ncbi:hypothetical protein BBP40_003793 [Aspergillus hancockii]|nr:hypothetical protein BBP40_003793 [Aspergillus hancockii]